MDPFGSVSLIILPKEKGEIKQKMHILCIFLKFTGTVVPKRHFSA